MMCTQFDVLFSRGEIELRIVIQRSKAAQVTVDKAVIGSIDRGLVILVGVTHEDTLEDAKYLVKKCANLRIFEDEAGKMNLSIKEVEGQALSISQFTLFGDTRKGRRPSFIQAAKPDQALELYEDFNKLLEEEGLQVETGKFGADMDISLTNDGPVTLIIDSKDR